jgi:hypothetical protein
MLSNLQSSELVYLNRIFYLDFNLNQFAPTDRARDLRHPGVGDNKIFAQHILENI